jgi:hypothetical protein
MLDHPLVGNVKTLTEIETERALAIPSFYVFHDPGAKDLTIFV